MKRILLTLLILLTISACTSNDTDAVEIQTLEYDGDHYSYQDYNYFLEKHGYLGEGSNIDKDNDLNVGSSTNSFMLTDDRSIDVIFLDKVQYDLKTIPVKESADCKKVCAGDICVCDLSDIYIQVDNMLFSKEDRDIAEYTKSEGMKKYSEEAEYNIVTIDDFLALLSDNDIEVRVNELETDIELAVPVTNAELERTPMAACVEIISPKGRFNLYQLFADPYESSADYALRYQRSYFDKDELRPLSDLGIWIDNLVLEILTTDEEVVNLFRSANW